MLKSKKSIKNKYRKEHTKLNSVGFHHLWCTLICLFTHGLCVYITVAWAIPKHNLVPRQWQMQMEASEQTSTRGSKHSMAWLWSDAPKSHVQHFETTDTLKDDTRFSIGHPSSECSLKDVSFSAFSRGARPFSTLSRKRLGGNSLISPHPQHLTGHLLLCWKNRLHFTGKGNRARKLVRWVGSDAETQTYISRLPQSKHSPMPASLHRREGKGSKELGV